MAKQVSKKESGCHATRWDGHAQTVLCGDVAENPCFETVPGLLIYRFDAPLVFTNSDRFGDEARVLVRDAEPPVKAVLIDCEMMFDMDTTAADQLTELNDILSSSGIPLMLARAHAPIRDFMRRDGVTDLLGEENMYQTVHDAVAAFEKTQQGVGSLDLYLPTSHIKQGGTPACIA